MEQPIHQIVHYSDLHIRGASYPQRRKALRKYTNRIKRTNPALYAKLEQGIEGDHRGALQALGDFLSTKITASAVWHDKPVWLVDTGDGTVFGNHDALDEWIDHWTPTFLAAAGAQAKQLVLYGNHDAWPGTFPLLAPSLVASQRDDLRRRWFTDAWPTPPLSVPIPNAAGSAIQLYALNSVDHRATPNAAARGKVLPDRFWQNPPPTNAPTAADALGRAVATHANPGAGRHLRILAMHYPVSDRALPASHRVYELLANRHVFAKELQSPRYGVLPMASLFLAGHTHEGFPEINALPRQLSTVRHPPLADGFCQLVTGSASQALWSGTLAPTNGSYAEDCRFDFPFQCAVLRFYSDAANPHEIRIERAIAGCPPGGAFDFLPLVPGGSAYFEQMAIAI